MDGEDVGDELEMEVEVEEGRLEDGEGEALEGDADQLI